MSVSYRGSKPVMCIQELGPFRYIPLLVSLKSSLRSPCVFVKILRPCLIYFFFVTQFLSLVTHHSSLITLKYYICLAPSLTSHYSIFFTLFVDPILVTRCSIFFFQYPNSPNPVKKKKKKKRKN